MDRRKLAFLVAGGVAVAAAVAGVAIWALTRKTDDVVPVPLPDDAVWDKFSDIASAHGTFVPEGGDSCKIKCAGDPNCLAYTNYHDGSKKCMVHMQSPSEAPWLTTDMDTYVKRSKTDPERKWGEWSACSTACGEGTATRECSVPGECVGNDSGPCSNGVCNLYFTVSEGAIPYPTQVPESYPGYDALACWNRCSADPSCAFARINTVDVAGQPSMCELYKDSDTVKPDPNYDTVSQPELDYKYPLDVGYKEAAFGKCPAGFIGTKNATCGDPPCLGPKYLICP